MKILFYTPINFRCKDIESLAQRFSQQGHEVTLLSQSIEGRLHHSFVSMGMKAYSLVVSNRIQVIWLARSISNVLTYCKANKIDLLFSHLEPTNLVSVIGQYFMKTRVVIYRHHVDLAQLKGFDKSWSYRLTYSLAKEIVSVSVAGKQYMINQEGVSEKKIRVIELGYDFTLFEKPDASKIENIQSSCHNQLILVTAGALESYKRPEISIEIVNRANKIGVKSHLIFLGTGSLEMNLKQVVIQMGLSDQVHFMGYVESVMDYLHAADWLIHPSISESSCVVVKEAALAELPAMVCKDVGDFDEYMIDSVNGVILDRGDFIDEAVNHLEKYQTLRNTYKQMGKVLKNEIINRFSIDRVISKYLSFTNHD
jgi:glycosyltransferase involved in cell wall biosynthesis